MIIMPSNVWDPMVRELDRQYPGRLGNLLSPGAWGRPLSDYYALDSGRYKAHGWTERAYWEHLDTAAKRSIPPRWVAMPDVFLDYNATLWGWEYWAPRVRTRYGWPLAFVWQNRITVDDVNNYTDAEVQFIGGDDNLHDGKWALLELARAAGFPRIHVGRVNAPRPALKCLRLGVESLDGTGWRRTDRQRDGLDRLLALMARAERYLEPPLFEASA